MDQVECPHCRCDNIAPHKVPKDVVAVLPCPECRELVVLFRRKAVGLDRHILESGSTDERKTHLANVIVEFLEPDLFQAALDGIARGADQADELDETITEVTPITEFDVDQFKDELACLDDPDYFHHHFG